MSKAIPIVSVILLLVVPAACLAQFESASVLGTVKDATGAVVRGSRVTLQNVNTGVANVTQTNDIGNYEFLNVRVGAYRVRAEAPGFKAALAEEFTVTVNARQRVDLTLTVGETTQTVDVKDAAAALETDSSDRGQVVSSTTIVNLPLNGRSYADLALLTPGVRRSFLGMDQSSSNYREGSFNVNGLRSALNNFQVDGVDNNAYNTSNQGYSNQAIQLSPDAIAEFKVQTNNFSAEYGRAGGAIVNVSVRSGTNAFHGAVWEFLRNTDLNAVGFFKPSYGKPVFQQNQFGGSLGGPVIKNKTFFFADYEGLRRVTRTLTYQTIPTLNQRNGIFGIPIKNPYTGEVYSNGVVPPSLITAFANKVFSQLVAPTLPGNANNYEALPSIPTTDNKGDFRADEYFSDKLMGFFRYSRREFNQTDTPVIPLPVGADTSNGNVNIVNKQVAGGLTYNMNPTSLVEFRLGVTQSIGGKWPVQIGLPNMQDGYGIPGLPTDPALAGGLNTQQINGFAGLGRRNSTPQFQNPLVVNPKANFAKVFSRHTLKVGYELQTVRTEILDFSPQYGQDGYSGQFSSPGGAQNTVYNVADFLFGARSSYALTNWFVAKYRQRMQFFYAQDDWKATTKLTLNLGLRYEYATPQWEDGLHLSNFDASGPKLVPASGGSMYNRALVKPDRNNFAPRVGLAYSVMPKTVVRSGFGISYIHFNRLGGENLLSYNPPSIIAITITNPNPLNAPICAQDVAATSCFRPTMLGYTSNQLSLSNLNLANTQLRYTPADTRTGYVMSWHFTIQRELANDLILDLAYVGNRSVKVVILGDYNQARPQNPGENVALNTRRPIPGFAAVEISWGGGFTAYNALQTKLEKRFSGGLYFLNSFTWSKVMDNAAGHLEVFNGDSSMVNYRDLKNDKGVGSYNQPFNNTSTLVWDLPYGKGRKFGSSVNPFLTALLGGWRGTLINTMASGLPVNLNYSPSSQFQVTNLTSYRPSLLGDPLAPLDQRTIGNYFNKANVVIPVDALHPNPFGNAGRNIVRAYAYYNTDLGLHKDFPLWKETRRLEFRAEFFNLFNKTNFQAPNSTRSASTFGTITSTFPWRMAQFALKFVF